MTHQLETITAGISTFASAVLGSQIFSALADAAPDQMPGWMKWLLGPLGALVGMILAIYWLSRRLDKAEIKADVREQERDNDRKTLITALVENSQVIREVKEVINKFK